MMLHSVKFTQWKLNKRFFYFANLTGCMYLNRHSGAIIIYEQVVQCNVQFGVTTFYCRKSVHKMYQARFFLIQLAIAKIPMFPQENILFCNRVLFTQNETAKTITSVLHVIHGRYGQSCLPLININRLMYACIVVVVFKINMN